MASAHQEKTYYYSKKPANDRQKRSAKPHALTVNWSEYGTKIVSFELIDNSIIELRELKIFSEKNDIIEWNGVSYSKLLVHKVSDHYKFATEIMLSPMEFVKEYPAYQLIYELNNSFKKLNDIATTVPTPGHSREVGRRSVVKTPKTTPKIKIGTQASKAKSIYRTPKSSKKLSSTLQCTSKKLNVTFMSPIDMSDTRTEVVLKYIEHLLHEYKDDVHIGIEDLELSVIHQSTTTPVHLPTDGKSGYITTALKKIDSILANSERDEVAQSLFSGKDDLSDGEDNPFVDHAAQHKELGINECISILRDKGCTVIHPAEQSLEVESIVVPTNLKNNVEINVLIDTLKEFCAGRKTQIQVLSTDAQDPKTIGHFIGSPVRQKQNRRRNTMEFSTVIRTPQQGPRKSDNGAACLRSPFVSFDDTYADGSSDIGEEFHRDTPSDAQAGPSVFFSPEVAYDAVYDSTENNDFSGDNSSRPAGEVLFPVAPDESVRYHLIPTLSQQIVLQQMSEPTTLSASFLLSCACANLPFDKIGAMTFCLGLILLAVGIYGGGILGAGIAMGLAATGLATGIAGAVTMLMNSKLSLFSSFSDNNPMDDNPHRNVGSEHGALLDCNAPF